MAQLSATPGAHKSDPGGEVREAAHDWMVRYARMGYATKGVIYMLVGMLALRAAWRAEDTDGEAGVIQQISEQPFGQILLALTAVGLLGYVVWRLVQAFADTEGKGRDLSGLVQRCGYLISAGAYLMLTYIAVRASLGEYIDTSGRSKKELTRWVLSWPFGSWLVAAVGVGVVAVGLYHFYRSYSAKFMREYDHDDMDSFHRGWIRWVGRLGLAARGVAFTLVGGFVAVAGWQIEPEQAKGLGEALDALAQRSYGWIMLAVVAIGFMAYGAYCLTMARFRDFAQD